jgi:hypothetical protein
MIAMKQSRLEQLRAALEGPLPRQQRAAVVRVVILLEQWIEFAVHCQGLILEEGDANEA